MKCPVCRVPMIVVEYKKIELDFCVKCSGVWFDSGELELLMETIKAAGNALPPSHLPEASKPESSEKKRKCPICGRKMDKMLVGKEPQVLIDRCPRGEGLWFDGGELGQVITQIAGTPSGKAQAHHILGFLGEAVGGNAKVDKKD